MLKLLQVVALKAAKILWLNRLVHSPVSKRYMSDLVGRLQVLNEVSLAFDDVVQLAHPLFDQLICLHLKFQVHLLFLFHFIFELVSFKLRRLRGNHS